MPCSFLIFIVKVPVISINEKGERRKTLNLIKRSADKCSRDQWPEPMPSLLPNPMVGFPTY